MTYEEFEVEKAQIELSYSEPIMEFNNQLREIKTRNADLTMQRAENDKEAMRIQSLLGSVIRERNKELLNLYRARVSEQQSN